MSHHHFWSIRQGAEELKHLNKLYCDRAYRRSIHFLFRWPAEGGVDHMQDASAWTEAWCFLWHMRVCRDVFCQPVIANAQKRMKLAQVCSFPINISVLNWVCSKLHPKLNKIDAGNFFTWRKAISHNGGHNWEVYLDGNASLFVNGSMSLSYII